MNQGRQERRLTTILSLDVVGYSQLMSKDESGTVATLQHLRRSEINPRVDTYNGQVIKLVGDGSIIEFSSVVDAVSFAVDVQHALARSQSKSQNRTGSSFASASMWATSSSMTKRYTAMA
ncbi:hypothetical protein [Sulfitobacter aestuariivivens]|uniref:hypothetical protein n=1 Tax=Sulfitobacter aestuariivivens TaxID=2766981 RepID=UPI00360CE633